MDGLQRISTLFELMGVLKDENGDVIPSLLLERTMYLPQMASMTWDGRDDSTELPQSVKLRIRRARIDVKIVLNKSDESVKYELFRRLNTGGSIATDQEVRNCLLIMTSKSFFSWFHELGDYPSFGATLPLSERAAEEGYDLELLTRSIVLHDIAAEHLSKEIELGAFLTQQMLDRAKRNQAWRDETQRTFEKTFDVLHEALDEDAFKKYIPAKDAGGGPVLISVFEVMALGIGFAVRANKKVSAAKVKSVHHSLWNDGEFTSAGGSGISAKTRLPKTLSIGRRMFA